MKFLHIKLKIGYGDSFFDITWANIGDTGPFLTPNTEQMK